MSAVVIIQMEGVMTDPSDVDTIPVANPSATGLRFVRALSAAWPVCYVTAAPREQALAWLDDVGAPSGAWVCSAPVPEARTAAIFAMLAERRDRAQLCVMTPGLGVGELQAHNVPVMLYLPTRDVLGDWKAPSGWTDSEPVDPEEKS